MKASITVCAALALASTAARAQPIDQVLPNAAPTVQCAPAAAALATLKSKYGEVPLFIGNQPDGTAIIVTERPDAASWTLLAIGNQPDVGAVACMIAAGEGALGKEPTQ